MPEYLPVIEMFKSLQGEGPMGGQRCVFVRFAFCDFSCSWCDTKYSWQQPQFVQMTPAQVAKQVRDLEPPAPVWVTLTGGNPVIQPSSLMFELIRELGPHTLFAIETQGTVWRDWLLHDAVRVLNVAPKLSNSGMQQTGDSVLNFLGQTYSRRNSSIQTNIKIVVFTKADVDEAVHTYYDILINHISDFTFQVGTEATDTDASLLERYRRIADYVLSKDLRKARVLPQLHVLLWGHRRGV